MMKLSNEWIEYLEKFSKTRIPRLFYECKQNRGIFRERRTKKRNLQKPSV
jgi:hypothetical protein